MIGVTLMGKRDNFSWKTQRALEGRAGHRCSFPGCPAVTIGPSEESAISVSKTGTACHIAAAAGGQGARRYMPNMTKDERISIENGIWMCAQHGKLIDTDERRFTIPMLKKWRELAEFRAQWAQEHGSEKPVPMHILAGRMGFADEDIKFTGLGNENEIIGRAFEDCCIEMLWPDGVSRAVRDVIIEIIRNSLTHGGASECLVQIRKGGIYIRDNGCDFSCLDLETRMNGRGGAAEIRHIM